MPSMDRASFMQNLSGKRLDAAALQRAYPALDLTGIAANGVIEGTSANLETLWKRIDTFDHDGNRNTIRDAGAVSIAQWVLGRAGVDVRPPSSGGVIPGVGSLPNDASWRSVAEHGGRSIAARMRAHHEAIEKTGIGRYYGDHSDLHDALRAGDRAVLDAFVKQASDGKWSVASFTHKSFAIKNAAGESATVKESSCIGWVMEHVEAAYRGAGKGARFDVIAQKMKDAQMRGSVLCEELQKDGWTAVFYSPRTADDLKSSGETDKLGALNMAKAGARVWKAGTVAGSRGVKVDAVVSGYREVTPDAKTEAALKRLEAAPFFVGIANGGVHTFVGGDGKVNDFHWTATPDHKDAMTENPLRAWEWDTGLYMVPPGYWKPSASADV